MKNFLKRFCTIVMVFAMVLTMMPAGSIAYAFDGITDTALEDEMSTEAGSYNEENITGEEQGGSEEVISADEAPVGDVPDEGAEDADILVEPELSAADGADAADEEEPAVKGPEDEEEPAVKGPEDADPAAETTIPDDAKFMVRVSSTASTGVGSVTGTVYDGYDADLVFDGQKVNSGNVDIEFWMQNVASLGVNELRNYKKSVNTGLGNNDYDLSIVRNLFSGFNNQSTVKVIADGANTTTYTIKNNEAGNVEAKADDNAGTVWHSIVNSTNMEAGLSNDDSYLLIAKGSYLCVGNQKLEFESTDDLKLDNITDPGKLVTDIKAAVKLTTVPDEAGTDIVEMYFAPGSKLAMGTSYVKLLKEARVTIDVADFDESALAGSLIELRDENDGKELVKKSFAIGANIINHMGGKQTTVTVNFGHVWNEEPVWKWTEAESGYTATATFICKNDPAHTETVNAVVTSTTGNETVYTATVQFNGKTYNNTKNVALNDDFKFRVKVSSEAYDGEGSVTGTVYNDYSADLIFKGENVNKAKAKIEFWMQNVASLSVTDTRYYAREITTNMTGDTSLSLVKDMFGSLDSAATVRAIIDGEEETSYIIKREGENVYATPDGNASTVWHKIVNETNMTAATSNEDDSYIEIANGSYLQIGDKKLKFEGDEPLKLDNFGNLMGMNDDVREALQLVDAGETADKVIIYLAPETKLAMGTSYVELKREVKITADIKNYDETTLTNVLEQLQQAKNVETMFRIGLTTMGTVIGEMGGQTTEVTVDFGHRKAEEHEAAEATCSATGNSAYWYCDICDKYFNEEGTEIDKDSWILPLKDHDYELTGWIWSKDHSNAEAVFTCKNNVSHVQRITASVGHEENAPTCEGAGEKTHTATVSFEGKTYTDSITEVTPAVGHTFGEPTWEWKDNSGEVIATATFMCSKCDKEHTVTVVPAEKVTKEPTCTEEGSKEYTAKVVLDTTTYTAPTTQTVAIPATDHDWGEPVVWNWADDYSSATATFTCQNDAEHKLEPQNAEVTFTSGNDPKYVATVELKGKTYTDTIKVLPDNFKFRVKVSSKTASNGTGSVTGTVYDDYKAELVFNGTKVNRSNAKVEFWMKNVASLGVTDTRYYGREVTTNLPEAGDNDLSMVSEFFAPLDTKAKVKAIVNGGECTRYTIRRDGDGNVIATPDGNASEVWHQIVNDTNMEADTKETDDSYLVVAKGSYMQIGSRKLELEEDAAEFRIDNVTGAMVLNDEIRGALRLTTVPEDEQTQNIVIFLEPGTELAMGTSYVKLNKEVKITTDLYDETLVNQLVSLQGQQSPENMILTGFGMIQTVVGKMAGTETTVNIDFGHKFEPVEAKDPTCENDGNIAYQYCEICDKYFDEAGQEISKDSVIKKATGHDWNEPTWTWADDFSSATATFECKNDSSHVEKADAVITSVTTNDVTYTATAEFNGKTYTDEKHGPVGDFKFRTRVSSVTADNTVGSVTGTVYEDYSADLVIDGDYVNKSNAKVEFWMQNVASLGVTDTRYYGREIQTELGNSDVSLSYVETLFEPLKNKATVKAVVEGGEYTRYTIQQKDSKHVYATPDGKASDVWHAIVKDENMSAETKDTEDSYLIIAKGSYMQVGTQKLEFEEGAADNLRIDNVTGIRKLNDDIRAALKLSTVEETDKKDGIVIFLEKGTELAMGQSHVTLNKEARITIDINGEEYDEAALAAQLENLQNSTEPNNMILTGLGVINTVITEMAGNETVVTFDFGHKMEEHPALEKTCLEDGNTAYWYCPVCDRYFSDANGENEIDSWVLTATGHVWGEPTYVWAADNSTVTATRVCTKDPSHIEEETVDVTSAVTTEPTCEAKGETTYTSAAFKNTDFAAQTKTEDIAKLGHVWGGPATWEWTQTEGGYTAKLTLICQNDRAHMNTVDATVTKGEGSDPTCEGTGVATYTAEATVDGVEYKDFKTVVTPETDHNYKFSEWKWLDGNTKAIAVFTCENDPDHVHNIEVNTSENVIPADCKADGKIVYTATVGFNGITKTDTKVVAIPATGHDWEGPVWTWTSDNTAKAAFKCNNNHDHDNTLTAEVEYTSGKDAHYTATVTGPDDKTYTDTKAASRDDFKFRTKVSSVAANGTTGSVTGTVYEDYTADLVFGGNVVSKSNAKVEFWMQNVASLGVSDLRYYGRTVEISTDPSNTSLSYVTSLFEPLDTKATVKAIVNGKEDTRYTIKREADGNVYATPDGNVANVWHAIVNEDNMTAGTNDADDSKMIIAHGSYLQAGNKKLEFEKDGDLTIDNVTGIAVLEASIKDALKLSDVAEDNKVTIFLEKGTQLVMGSSYVTLDKEVRITVDVKGFDEKDLADTLVALRDATPEGMILTTFGAMGTVIEAMSGHKTVVNIDFGHDTELVAAVPATCTEAGTVEYWHCDICDRDFKDEAGTTPITEEEKVEAALDHTWGEWTVVTEATCEEDGLMTRTCTRCGATDEETQAIAATGHDWKAPTWKWADDFSSATATFECKNDPSHTKELTDNKPVYTTGNNAGYTATVKLDGKPYTDFISALGDDYKFRVRVSSDTAENGTGSVTGTVYRDYTADLIINGDYVNRSNAGIEFWMQNVASLGVTDTRYYGRTVDTTLTGPDTSLDVVRQLFAPLSDKALVKAIVNGEEDTRYTVKLGEDGNVYATPDGNVANVWHAIVNEDNIEASTDPADDSYMVIANGSYLQIGDQKLGFESDGDLTLDNLGDLQALEENIRGALKLETADPTDKVVIFLEPGTKLAMGTSYATLKKEVKITVDIKGYDEAELAGKLAELRSGNAQSMILTGLDVLGTVIGKMAGTETVVTIDFGHKTTKVEEVPATCTEAGTHEYWHCDICDKDFKDEAGTTEITEKEKVIPAAGHVWGEWTVTKEATCTEDGFKTRTCTVCGVTDEETQTIDKTEHDYQLSHWTWADDHSSATATFICNNDANHTLTENAVITSEDTTVATCEGTGIKAYTATVTVDFGEKTYTDSITEVTTPAGHNWTGPAWSWAEDYSTATATFTCQNNEEHQHNIVVTPLIMVNDPTCDAEGLRTYIAKIVINGNEYEDTKTEAIEATGHKWGEPTWTWSEDYSTVTATFVCENDPEHKETKTAAVTVDEGRETTYTATVTGPDDKPYADVKTKPAGEFKFRARVSSDTGDGKGSVTGTVYADYKADLVFTGDSVNRSNAAVEMWMHNVASLGVNGDRYYKTAFETGLSDKNYPMEYVKSFFTGLDKEGTTIIGKIGDKSTTYTVTKTAEGNYEATPDTEEAARAVWHAIVNKENMAAGTGADDSYIIIANGSYFHIGNQLLKFQNEEGDLKLDNFSKPDGIEESIRDAVVLSEAESIENIEIYLEPGTVLSVGSSQVELLKDAKITIDIAGMSDEEKASLMGILPALKESGNLSQLIVNGLGGMKTVLDVMGGKTTTVEFEFGHDWSEPQYVWADDFGSCTATIECGNNHKHDVTETVNATSEVTKEATCTEAGETTYTAVFADELFETQTRTKADIEAAGHKYGEPTYTWSEDNTSVTATMVCEKCGDTVTEIVNATSEVTKEATCEVKGEITYKSAAFENEAFTVQTKKSETDALGHDWNKPVWNWAEEFSTATVSVTCKRDASHVATAEASVVSSTTAATCEKAGETVHVGFAVLNGKLEKDTQKQAIAATGHTAGEKVRENEVAATCTAAGSYDEAVYCTVCDKELSRETKTVPALGHNYGEPVWKWNDDYTEAKATFTCKNDSTHTETLDAAITDKVTVEPTCEGTGTTEHTATVTFNGKTYTDKVTEVTSAKGHTFGEPVWSWNDSMTEATATFSCSNNVPEHAHTITIAPTVTVKDATCEEAGSKTYTAKIVIGGKTYEDTKTAAGDPATGHKYGEPEYTWSDDNKTVTAIMVCENNEEHVVTETANTTSEVKAATCEEDGSITYVANFKNDAFKPQTKTVAGDPATGHKWGEPTYTWSDDNKTVTATSACENDKNDVLTETAETKSETVAPTCEEDGYTTYTAFFRNEPFGEQTKKVDGEKAFGHKWGEPEWTWSEDYTEATAKFVCENDANHVKEVKAEVTKEEGPEYTVYTAKVTGPDGKPYEDEQAIEVIYDDILRIFGDNRYTTAFKNADKLKEVLRVSKFNAVVVATGTNFPDSLSGAYLANVKNAPMLLINAKKAQNVCSYIKNNLNSGGTIYILGGEGVVKSEWLADLSYNKVRLGGDTRYDTNLEVLKEVGYKGGDILAATGVNYPDSLSGSSLNMPILLVKGDTLMSQQETFLNGLTSKPNFYIAGGTGAVSAGMENVLKTKGTIAKRFAGSDRYETSRLIAEEFFKNPSKAILAVGNNFPDGLSVGPLAAKMKTPILLAYNNDKSVEASKYTKAHSIKTGIVIGGPLLIWDATAKEVLHNDTIIIYEEGMYLKPIDEYQN